MKMERAVIGVCGLLMLPALSLHAQSLDVQPGLWELTSTTHTSGMPPARAASGSTRLRAPIVSRQSWPKTSAGGHVNGRRKRSPRPIGRPAVSRRTRTPQMPSCGGPGTPKRMSSSSTIAPSGIRRTRAVVSP